mmetsp:Transcript_4062/g.18014  ORF Transcript_4062/g.18014 Transcript_4062/m.18014 type:complete len:290 (-) Transcript_4062:739-1608(-)
MGFLLVSMLAVLSPQRRSRELLDEGVALVLDGGERGGGSSLVLLADGEVELLDGGVESLGRSLVATLVRNEVVHVEAEGTNLAAELVGGLGPVGLADVLTHVSVEALDGLGRAGRGLGSGELLEGEAGVAVLAHGLRDVEITGLVDELETVLVGLALVLELDLVERHGGGGLESDDTGREEGGSLASIGGGGHGDGRLGLGGGLRLDEGLAGEHGSSGGNGSHFDEYKARLRSGSVRISEIPCTPWRSTSSARRNASCRGASSITTSNSLSLGMTIRVSTFALSCSIDS